MSYVIGWNMPGYLPEADPIEVGSLQEARDALAAEIGRHLDQIYDSDPAEAERAERVLDEFRQLPPQMCSVFVGGYLYWISDRR